MVLGLKEGLVECATACVKSVVILMAFMAVNLEKEEKSGDVKAHPKLQQRAP